MIGICESCGNTVLCPVYYMFSVGTDITIKGAEGPCPKCNQLTKILDGTFSKNEDGSISFLNGPKESERIFLQLKESEDKQKNSVDESNTSRSRHIPSKISKAVNERHFFECAWCGENLSERHHIEEYSLGGNTLKKT